MAFDRSRSVTSGLIEVASSSSTNSELSARADREGFPDLTVMLTRYQSAGRGRLGRSWNAPPGAALAASVLLRPRLADGTPVGPERLGWVPLIAGVAMAEAVASVLPERPVGFKWPNDVLVDGRKISGILAELLPSGTGVVVGSGINTRMTAEELPVPTATSLAVEGLAVDDALEDLVLAVYLEGLRDRMRRYLEAGCDAEVAGIRAQARARCVTLGRPVRVLMPDDSELRGDAVDLDVDGRLVVTGPDGQSRSVAAGDVTHVR